jgi:preprotein translocase SecE subunit
MNTSKRLALAFFLLASLITLIVLSKTFVSVLAVMGVQDASLLGKGFTLSTLLAVFSTVGLLFYFLKKTTAWIFVNESTDELSKVTWPTAEENKRRTIQTFVISAVVSVILFTFDAVFSTLTDFILTR